MLTIDIIERIQRLPHQNEETLSDVFGILMGIENRASADHYVRWVRKEAMKLKTEEERYKTSCGR